MYREVSKKTSQNVFLGFWCKVLCPCGLAIVLLAVNQCTLVVEVSVKRIASMLIQTHVLQECDLPCETKKNVEFTIFAALETVRGIKLTANEF